MLLSIDVSKSQKYAKKVCQHVRHHEVKTLSNLRLLDFCVRDPPILIIVVKLTNPHVHIIFTTPPGKVFGYRIFLVEQTNKRQLELGAAVRIPTHEVVQKLKAFESSTDSTSTSNALFPKTPFSKKQATMKEAATTPDIVWSSRARSDSVSSMASTSDDGERRLLARERNKEHARKTRLRKKEQLQSLKSRVNELEEEGRRLKQQIEACSVASILVGLSHGSSTGQEEMSGEDSSAPKNYGETLSGGKRKRFLSLDGEEPSPPPMELNIKGHITLVGGPAGEGKTQINWKTGVYFDDQGQRHQLSKKELEELR